MYVDNAVYIYCFLTLNGWVYSALLLSPYVVSLVYGGSARQTRALFQPATSSARSEQVHILDLDLSFPVYLF